MHTIYISSILKGEKTNHETALAYMVEARKTDEESGKLLEITHSKRCITLQAAEYQAYQLADEYRCKVVKEWESGIIRELEIQCYAMAGDTLSRPDAVEYYDISVLNSDTSGEQVTLIIEEFEDLTLDQAGKILDGLEQKYATVTSWIEA